MNDDDVQTETQYRRGISPERVIAKELVTGSSVDADGFVNTHRLKSFKSPSESVNQPVLILKQVGVSTNRNEPVFCDREGNLYRLERI